RSVISLGGGAVGSRAVRLAVRKTGHLIWLRAPVPLCAERAATGRPLLAGNPAARLEELAAAREPLYARLADGVLEVVPGASSHDRVGKDPRRGRGDVRSPVRARRRTRRLRRRPRRRRAHRPRWLLRRRVPAWRAVGQRPLDAAGAGRCRPGREDRRELARW